MKPGAKGFVWGAVIASAAMVALPEFVDFAFGEGSLDRRQVEIVAVGTSAPGGFPRGADIAGLPILPTHHWSETRAMAVTRWRSYRDLTRNFSIAVSGASYAFEATGRLCPIVVLATPDEIRISPCLARVAAK
jgi:hypothetical protein